MSQNKPKGTPKTEVIIGTAATRLESAVKSILEASKVAPELEKSLIEYNLKVTDLETKISGLQQDYSNKKAQAEIDLGLAYKAAQKQFASTFLSEME